MTSNSDQRNSTDPSNMTSSSNKDAEVTSATSIERRVQRRVQKAITIKLDVVKGGRSWGSPLMLLLCLVLMLLMMQIHDFLAMNYSNSIQVFDIPQVLSKHDDTKLDKSQKPKFNIPTTSCAILLFGLARSPNITFPTIHEHILMVNPECDVYVHTYSESNETKFSFDWTQIYELSDNVQIQTQEEFHQAHNVSYYHQFFPHGAGWIYPLGMDNMIKQWHSIQQAWNLMDESGKQYNRVGLFRIDCYYTDPVNMRHGSAVVPYFWNRINPDNYWVWMNDRLFFGTYENAKVWATKRFDLVETAWKESDDKKILQSERYLAWLFRFHNFTAKTVERRPICSYRVRANGRFVKTYTCWNHQTVLEQALQGNSSLVTNFSNPIQVFDIPQVLKHDETKLDKSQKPKFNIPTTSCAILLFGLARSPNITFPTIHEHILMVNPECDVYVHTYSESNETKFSFDRTQIYELSDNVQIQTQEEFHQAHNVSYYHQFFPHGAGWIYPLGMDNMIKQWHSIQQAWNLMDESGKQYDRVGLFRIDCYYTDPVNMRHGSAVVPYFMNWIKSDNFWKLMNDRLFFGTYENAKVWATKRFDLVETAWKTAGDKDILASEMYLAWLFRFHNFTTNTVERRPICSYRVRANGRFVKRYTCSDHQTMLEEALNVKSPKGMRRRRKQQKKQKQARM